MKKITACLLCICLAATLLTITPTAKESSSDNSKYTIEELVYSGAQDNSYDRFLADEALPDAVGENLILSAQDAVVTSDAYGWRFESEISGRYYLKVKYIVKDESLSDIEADITVNGTVPYDELKEFVLPKEYRDAGEPEDDIYGNQIAPDQIISDGMVETYIFDYAGVHAQPLSVNINSGSNAIDFFAPADDIELYELILVPAGNRVGYEEYRKAYTDVPVYSGGNLIIEGEDAELKSDSVLSPKSDKSSPLVSPIKTGKILLNTIGGYSWNSANQYIKWNVTVPKSGLYTLSFKVRQNRNVGQTVYRALYINGDIPFDEVSCIKIDYSSKWQMITPGTGEESFLFYLTEGQNEIMLSATLGESDKVIRAVDNAVKELNAVYRKLLVVLGSEPDLNKDYKLQKNVPELIEELGIIADKLESMADVYEEINGGKNANTATLRTLVRQLKEMNDDSDKIPSEFSYFKTNIGSLATNQASAKEQPLEVDYFVLSEDASQLPAHTADFLGQFIFSVKEFLCSFTIDYKNIGTIEKSSEGEVITAWMSSGRDQAQIIRSLISDDFTPNTGYKVKLELVAASSLLPASVAGVGPDVYIGTGDVINFAMRNAAYDLTAFSDFEEVACRFHPSAFISLTYMDGVYALPDNMSFYVMYYRTDILEELGLEVPQTWDDIIAMSSVLSVNNMSFGLPAGSDMFLMMVKQKGLDIYRQNGAVCALDQPAAIDLFRYYTNFYNNYGFPLTYSLVNRFRTGEIPIAIDSVSLYNSLEISAPEIKGLWSFSMVPGFGDDDGFVNRTSLASGTAVMMLDQSKSRNEAWEFMKWYTSADIQSKYGREVESVLGTSGRYTSANLEAFRQSMWGREEISVLSEQMEQLDAVEQVPGGYYLARNISNAFRNVVYYDKKPMDVMFDYVYKINGELTEKRVELGLQTAKGDE